MFPNGSLSLEGKLQARAGDEGIVICHPHPQMGGSMYNNVVETIRDVFVQNHYSSLRFNFRGVGESTGRYDEGKGEVQDVLSACEYMRGKNIRKLSLAGYSFGAWICCRLLKNHPDNFESVILVSPPDKFFPFDWGGLEGKISFVINGDLDPFCDMESVKRASARIGARHLILNNVDHFYGGDESRLSEGLKQFLKEKHS